MFSRILCLVLLFTSSFAERQCHFEKSSFAFESQLDDYLPFPCQIERRPALTLDEFQNEYLQKKPVIFSDLGANQKFRELCQRDALLSNWGDYEVTLSSANSYSYEKQRARLTTYIEEMMGPQGEQDGAHTFYHFGDHKPEFEPLFGHYVLPRVWNVSLGHPALSWGLAGDGSGVPFHVHGHVFAEVLHGRKHWFLTPPESTPVFDPDEPPLRWLQKRFAGERQPPEVEAALLECTVEAGEIIYLPGMWWHATLNLGQAVFISAFVFMCGPPLQLVPIVGTVAISEKGQTKSGSSKIYESLLALWSLASGTV